MSPKKIYAALDIGHVGVKLLVGEMVGSKINILNIDAVSHDGIVGSSIVNKQAIIEAIKTLIARSNQLLNVDIQAVVVSIFPTVNKLYHVTTKVSVARSSELITTRDISKGIKQVAMTDLPDNEEIVNILIRDYIVPEIGVVSNPVGLKSSSFELDCVVVTGEREQLLDVLECVEKSGIQILDICFTPYADALESLSEDNLINGALLVNVGSTHTVVTQIRNNVIEKVTSIPLGGNKITTDIAYVLGCEMEKAEMLKKKYSTLLLDDLCKTVIHETSEKVFYDETVLEIVISRLTQILQEVKKIVDSDESSQVLPITFTGKTSDIKVFKSIVDYIFEEKEHHVYKVDVIGARGSTYTTAFGLLRYIDDKRKKRGSVSDSFVVTDFEKTLELKRKGYGFGTQTANESFMSRLLKNVFKEEIED